MAFHRIIFQLRLSYKKMLKIDIIDIDGVYLNIAQHKIFEANKGDELEDAIELANIETFDHSCSRIKITLL